MQKQFPLNEMLRFAIKSIILCLSIPLHFYQLQVVEMKTSKREIITSDES